MTANTVIARSAEQPARDETPAAAFARLIDDVRACTACDRMAHAHVLGAANGPLDAKVLFIAEAVGRRGGAITGVPLTRDETGQRFGRFLECARIDRSTVFVTNAVLCNPLDARARNRSPGAAEVTRCRPFLARTLEIVRAPYVVTLGRVALKSLSAVAPHDRQLGAHVAQDSPWRGGTLIPLYHPSRQSTLHRSQALQEDDWRTLGELIRGGSR